MPYRLLKWVTPNQLTMGRIFAVPVLMGLIFKERPETNWAALLVFTLAGLTDYVDGELARYRGEVTVLGRMLDPLADKLLISACLIMLVGTGHAGAVPAILIILREFAVSGLRQVAALDGVEIHVVRGAKWKTGLQMGATGFLLVHHDPIGIPSLLIGQTLLWAAAVVTVWTGYVYFASFFKKGFPKTGESQANPKDEPPAEDNLPLTEDTEREPPSGN